MYWFIFLQQPAPSVGAAIIVINHKRKIMNTIKPLLFALVLAGAVPAAAQSEANFNINAGGNTYDITGGTLSIELTNLAEDFFMATMALDGKLFAENLKTMDLQANMISPFELNNSTRTENKTINTYNTDDGGAIVLTTTTQSDGSSTSTTIEISTTKKKDDGSTETDTITIILNPQEGPVIRTDP